MAGAANWTTDDVSKWLQQNGFGKYAELICIEHDIDGQVLLLLTENDLRSPPLSLSVLGDIKRLMIKITQLRLENGLDEVDNSVLYPQNIVGQNRRHSSSRTIQSRRRSSQYKNQPFNGNLSSRSSKVVHFIPEKRKTFLSFIYVFLVFLLTAFTMVEVHDRVPDMER